MRKPSAALLFLAVAATAYGLTVATIAAVAVAGPLRSRELDAVLAGVNAVLATLTVLGLAWVSSGTTVTVSGAGFLPAHLPARQRELAEESHQKRHQHADVGVGPRPVALWSEA